jgi:hypothetical protein
LALGAYSSGRLEAAGIFLMEKDIIEEGRRKKDETGDWMYGVGGFGVCVAGGGL